MSQSVRDELSDLRATHERLIDELRAAESISGVARGEGETLRAECVRLQHAVSTTEAAETITRREMERLRMDCDQMRVTIEETKVAADSAREESEQLRAECARLVEVAAADREAAIDERFKVAVAREHAQRENERADAAEKSATQERAVAEAAEARETNLRGALRELREIVIVAERTRVATTHFNAVNMEEANGRAAITSAAAADVVAISATVKASLERATDRMRTRETRLNYAQVEETAERARISFAAASGSYSLCTRFASDAVLIAASNASRHAATVGATLDDIMRRDALAQAAYRAQVEELRDESARLRDELNELREVKHVAQRETREAEERRFAAEKQLRASGLALVNVRNELENVRRLREDHEAAATVKIAELSARVTTAEAAARDESRRADELNAEILKTRKSAEEATTRELSDLRRSFEEEKVREIAILRRTFEDAKRAEVTALRRILEEEHTQEVATVRKTTSEQQITELAAIKKAAADERRQKVAEERKGAEEHREREIELRLRLTSLETLNEEQSRRIESLVKDAEAQRADAEAVVKKLSRATKTATGEARNAASEAAAAAVEQLATAKELAAARAAYAESQRETHQSQLKLVELDHALQASEQNANRAKAQLDEWVTRHRKIQEDKQALEMTHESVNIERSRLLMDLSDVRKRCEDLERAVKAAKEETALFQRQLTEAQAAATAESMKNSLLQNELTETRERVRAREREAAALRQTPLNANIELPRSPVQRASRVSSSRAIGAELTLNSTSQQADARVGRQFAAGAAPTRSSSLFSRIAVAGLHFPPGVTSESHDGRSKENEAYEPLALRESHDNCSSEYDRYPYLGLEVSEGIRFDKNIGRVGYNGIRVHAVKGPAVHAGLCQDDIITALDDAPVTSLADFERACARLRPNETVRLDVRRDSMTIELTLKPAPCGLPPGALGRYTNSVKVLGLPAPTPHVALRNPSRSRPRRDSISSTSTGAPRPLAVVDRNAPSAIGRVKVAPGVPVNGSDGQHKSNHDARDLEDEADEALWEARRAISEVLSTRSEARVRCNC